MSKLFDVTLMFVCGMCRISMTIYSCPYKVCDCEGTEIECAGRGLASMPVLYNTEETGYLTLFLDTNNIREVTAGTLPAGLADISLNNNPITSIDNDTFSQLSTTLATLYFSSANFTRITDAFLHLNVLRSLSIYDTTILDWNSAAMTHIGQTLETLSLANVGFTTWPVWLRNCSRLIQLEIVNSEIASIPDSAFDDVADSLITLILYNNSLSGIPKSISVLRNLLTLDLHYNKIVSITSLPQPGKLSDLSLGNNFISDASQLSHMLRPHADSLVSLAFSFNRLTTIPDLSFLTKVTSLDLNNNQISATFSGSVPSDLHLLSLGYNFLSHIPPIYKQVERLSFMDLPHNVIREVVGTDIPTWIKDIHLDFNVITELTDTSFPVNSSLQTLTLDNVPIIKISNLAFINLRFLVSLNMANTKLTRLPLSLAYLHGIGFLDLRNNTSLVCTCLEKDLAPIITSGIDLSGDCGSISIYDFFTTLSGNCP